MMSAESGAQPQVPAPEQSNILVVGLARDCAAHLEVEVARLTVALGFARRIQFLVVESDSSDATIPVLQALSARIDGFRFGSLGQLAPHIPSRTARIAHCRNAYVRELRENPLYSDVDLVAVADLDGANPLLSRAAVESCWQRTDWDMAAANQAAPYYDVWALRHPLWSPNDCWQQARFLVGYNPDQRAVLAAAVHSRMIRLPETEPWVAVDSAFGGFALYRKAMFDIGHYVGLYEDGQEVCEHVPFHAMLRGAGARLYINPRLINAEWNEHSLEMLKP